jgi:hypothetical protein
MASLLRNQDGTDRNCLISPARDREEALIELLPEVVAVYRRHLTNRFVLRHGSRVLSGPFEGMRLAIESSWGDGDLLAKLSGSYESALHDVIEFVKQTPYVSVVNVGCSEGYYAIGLARAFPGITVHAFDTDEAARRVCSGNSRLNGVGNIIIEDHCTVEALEHVAQSGRVFLLLDCEGAELSLLRPRRALALVNADILVECHDILRREITSTLIDRFSPSHVIRRIDESACLDPKPDCLNDLSGFDRALATCEFRPVSMHWLLLLSRVHAGQSAPAFSPAGNEMKLEPLINYDHGT